MVYELTTLSCSLLATEEVAEGISAWVRDAAAVGSLLGCWRTEIGALGRMIVLREFETPEMLAAERERAHRSDRPFNAGVAVTALEMDSYAPFPFLPPVRLGARGPVYEVRTYRLKPGGLPPTLAGWRQAMEPAREYTAHLAINMYALDGAPRITHIWGFADLAERADLRTRHYAAGTWPPPGCPEQIAAATSTIAMPLGFSPLA